MPTSLSSLIMEYPFEKCDDLSSLAGVHGVFIMICCQPADGGIECNLLDFGGSVDLKCAIETNSAINNWRKKCNLPVNIMVAVVSPMNCEALLEKLQQILHNSNNNES